MREASHLDLLTPAQAARLMDVSREWVRRLMRDGRLPLVEIAGRPFVRYSDVMSYKPGPKTGRPSKP
jgi:excisionase family DNA binding protein